MDFQKLTSSHPNPPSQNSPIFAPMKYPLLLIGAILLFSASVFAQQYTIEGTIRDNSTNAPLAFVTVFIPGQNIGNVSDIDGRYKLTYSTPFDSIVFSYLGYDTYIYVPKNESSSQKNIHLDIHLNQKHFALKEMVFVAGENPANRIINKAIENRDQNNPDKLHSYTYTTYNKFVFGTNVDSIMKSWAKQDSLDKEKGAGALLRKLDSAKYRKDSLEKDSSRKWTMNFLNNSYLFLVESVSEKKFLYPDFSKETVIASKVSGFKNPEFSLIASEMQSFSFYNDYFVLLERNYLNPLSKGSTHKYFFNIEDTTWNGKDTVFIISFKPFPNKNFEGMKGVLYFNTNGYAVQNVITEPAESSGQLSMKIQQQYELMDGKHWFPKQLNTDLIAKGVFNGTADLKGVGRTYIRDVKFDTALRKSGFDDITLDYQTGMKAQNDSFWNKYRIDTLTLKEQNTYKVIDSLGKEAHLDRTLKLLLALSDNRLPIGIFDLNLDKIINENLHEGIRLGLGVHTNKEFSKWLMIGGFGAYGFKDEKIKYGGDMSILLYKRRDIRIGCSYAHDVVESGAQSFYDDEKSFLNEEFRKFTIRKMDAVEDRKAFISGNFIKYLKASIYIKESHTMATDNYQFYNNDGGLTNDFHFTETGIGLRYAYKEKFVKAFDQKLSNGTNYPVLWLNISHGWNNLLQGNYTYTRYDLQIKKSFRIRNVGRSVFIINAGWVDGAAPYPILFNGKGSEYNIDNIYHLSFYSDNSFQTMGLNEFLSNRFVAVYYHHNFGHLLFKAKHFQPSLSIISNAGIGWLNNPQQQFGMESKTMNKGYYESGFQINNLLKLGFTRLGIGTYYRYGPYSDPMPKNNIYFKVSTRFFL